MPKLTVDIVIVGSGVGGATLAKELTKSGKKVLVLEKGGVYPPRLYGRQFEAAKYYDGFGLLSKAKKGRVTYYRTLCAGGTSIVSCGNGVRSLESELRNLGIDLSNEFTEAEKELKINPVPDNFLGRYTRAIMEASNNLGFRMVPMPKFINFDKCVSCGNCDLGCFTRAKWSALEYLKEAQDEGVTLIKKTKVTKVMVSNGRAVGVVAYTPLRRKLKVNCDCIILAAGGIGTPIILQNSGIQAGEGLFLDLFNITVGFVKGEGSSKEVTMAAVHHNDGFILSPFVDCKLALAAILPFRHIPKISFQKNMIGIMTKIKDDREGKVNKNGAVEKIVTQGDFSKLKRGSDISKEILIGAGADPKSITVTNIRGAHPGGTAAIGKVVNKNFETRIKGLFVCDASVFPETPGLPPIVTIIALAKRLAKGLK